MQLLERERDLATLAAALAAAQAGLGCMVLVSGEAGIGKTSFVEHFAAQARVARSQGQLRRALHAIAARATV